MASLAGCQRASAALQETPLASGTPVVGQLAGFDDPHRWSGRVLRVGAWGGEVQEALRAVVWTSFAEATGCTVDDFRVDYAELVAATRSGRPYADVLLVDEMWASRGLNQGFIQTITLGPDGESFLPAFPIDVSSIPAYAYALISGYRRDVIDDAPPGSWKEWWDAGRFPGPRALARDPFGTFEFALLADGVHPEALYPLDENRAIESLKRISGNIVERWWDSGSQPLTWLANERAAFTSAWHYRIIAGQHDGIAVGLTWNQGLLLTDRWVIPATTDEPSLAIDFLTYAARPEVQAALAMVVPLGPVTSGAFQHLEPRRLSQLPTTPSNLASLIRPDIEWWSTNQGSAVELFNTWLLGVSRV